MAYFLRLSVLPLILFFPFQAFAEILIIGHPGITSPLSAHQVREVYLNTLQVLPGGQLVQPVDQDKNSDVRKEFYRRIIKMNHSQLRAYWSKRVFMEKGDRPIAIASDKMVIQWVARTPGAVGYIGRRPKTKKVRVLLYVP